VQRPALRRLRDVLDGEPPSGSEHARRFRRARRGCRRRAHTYPSFRTCPRRRLFFVIRNSWLCAPGVVFPSLLSEYRLSSTLEHVLWVPPFPWEQLGAIEIGPGTRVHWLLAVPISEPERQLLEERGFDAFEALFAELEVEYFDLERGSIV
jgi:hypothetical protein